MHPIIRIATAAAITISSLAVVSAASAGDSDGGNDAIGYWNAARVASAQPRDLVIDHRGLGYLRGADGNLRPYGHSVPAAAPPLSTTAVAGVQRTPQVSGVPSPTAVSFGTMDPADGATIGSSHTFEARITSTNGIRRATANVGVVGGGYQSFRMSYVGQDAGAEIWRVNLQGFTGGNWRWYVSARDGGPRGGTDFDSSLVAFTVDAGSGSGGTVVSERWTGGGQVQSAAGRILFTMPDGNYVCSGTAITDGVTGRSIILTAAHCVYDDVNKAFSSNAIFIPDQDGTTGLGTDWTCSNDPYGCWSVDHGVVDLDWTIREFPDNIAWDYGYYVVSDSGAHSGTAAPDALDQAVGSLGVSFAAPTVGDSTTALGYSYADDPFFMYCQESMGTNGAANYWLDSCDLTGGSSGGPWMQPLDGGNGTVISVNSWGYTMFPGMAGPKLHDNTAELVFQAATCSDLASADRGVVVDATNPPTCSASSTTTTVAATTTTTVAVSGLSITVDAYKTRGTKYGLIEWTGSASGTVDIVRDGIVRTTQSGSSGSYLDNTGQNGGGTTEWWVCEAGTTTCSDVYVHTW